jgi:hypothetical protein
MLGLYNMLCLLQKMTKKKDFWKATGLTKKM